MQHQAGSLYYKVIKMSKILLVDDDIELTDLLAEVLRLTGFEVEVANNGQEALDKPLPEVAKQDENNTIISTPENTGKKSWWKFW